MNLWLKSVDDVIVLAPKVDRKPESSETSYSSSLKFTEVSPLNFTGPGKALISISKIPGIARKIWIVFRQCDHIHLRCPGNISLLGCIIQVFFPKKKKTVKYAGNWDPNSKQPWSYRFQKAILRNRFLSKNLKVLVYGKWKKQSSNVVPFFTASFSENERVSVAKEYSGNLKFIFVGTLSEGKQPLFAIQLVEHLLENGINASLKLYGSGILEQDLNKYLSNSRFSDSISLEGFIDKQDLKKEYLNSHFLVLPSKSEGWPKAVAEAMFFGCIPIATSISCVPWMLDHGGRGILIPDNIKSARRIVHEKILDKTKLKEMAERAQNWSQEYTLEKFEQEITRFL